jgi:predicted PurR-regulated permease PerM
MTSPPATVSSSGLQVVGTVVAVFAVLRFAQDALIPLALAGLSSFLLAPVVLRLQRWGLGRVLAILVVLALAICFTSALSWILFVQLVDLGRESPKYRDNIVRKIAAVRGSGSGMDRAIRDLESQFAEGPVGAILLPSKGTAGGVPASTGPVFVRIAAPTTTSLGLLRSMLGPLLAPLATVGVVIVFAAFMLIEREELRGRLIRLLGRGQINRTTAAIDDAGTRISNYVRTQATVNGAFGILATLGLWVIGVPNASLWGLLTTILRFIPYLGVWLAASLPILLATALSSGWTQPMQVAGLYLLVELVIANALEPLLYGSGTGLSPMAVLTGAIFWGWMWGMPGLLLATPLTVCIAVLGRFVPQLGFLDVMLSDTEALTPKLQLYQRLLAMDVREAEERSRAFLKDRSMNELYDSLLLPALALVEEDRQRGQMPDEHRQFIYQSIRELVEALGDERPVSVAVTELKTRGNCVLCLPARNEADEIVGAMLAQLLESRDVYAATAPFELAMSQLPDQIALHEATLVCISVLPSTTPIYARRLCKRIRNRYPKLKIVVGLWYTEGDMSEVREQLLASGADRVVSNLQEAVAYFIPEPVAVEQPVEPGGRDVPAIQNA